MLFKEIIVHCFKFLVLFFGCFADLDALVLLLLC